MKSRAVQEKIHENKASVKGWVINMLASNACICADLMCDTA